MSSAGKWTLKHKPVFPYYGKHKTSTSPEKGCCVKWKPAPTQDGLFPLRQEGDASTIPNTRVLCKVKRGRPTQAQEKEQLILFCLYLCLCFILSCLQHKLKDNFASVARENFNPVQNGRKNVDPLTPLKSRMGKSWRVWRLHAWFSGGWRHAVPFYSVL